MDLYEIQGDIQWIWRGRGGAKFLGYEDDQYWNYLAHDRESLLEKFEEEYGKS